MQGKKGCRSWSNTDLFITVSLQVAVSHTKRVGQSPQRSEGCPTTIPIAACCSSMCCDIQTVTTAKMDTKHWRLCDSVSALNHLHRCHIHFITTSSCSASVLRGREKSWVLQMCRAETTIKQVTDQRNSPGVFTVEDTQMLFLLEVTRWTDRQQCLLQSWLTTSKWHHVGSRTFAYKAI